MTRATGLAALRDRLWPRTLTGRVAAVLVVALTLTHVVAIAWLLGGRAMLARDLMFDYLGPDVASSVAMLERLPADERAVWLPRLARSNYRYSLGGDDARTLDDSWPAQQIARKLQQALGAERGLTVRHGREPGQRTVQLRLADGSRLTIELWPLQTGLSGLLYVALLLQLIVVLGAACYALRHTTHSLGRLVEAAEAVDPERPGAPLLTQGPIEIARVTAAFNAMQCRVAHHHAERARLLAAIAHDLQTPITRMQLRTELAGDAPFREKTQRDLVEMQALVEQGIAYARSAHAVAEEACRLDLNALLDGLVCDHVDAGHDVRFADSSRVTLVSRPQALRRLIGNLISNAVKFSGSAELCLRQSPMGLEIVVSDNGPGIPEDQLAAVKAPFHRVESSRNRDSGGAGLGLAIADELARALGGSLTLVNRQGGGLDAILRLTRHGLAPKSA